MSTYVTHYHVYTYSMLKKINQLRMYNHKKIILVNKKIADLVSIIDWYEETIDILIIQINNKYQSLLSKHRPFKYSAEEYRSILYFMKFVSISE